MFFLKFFGIYHLFGHLAIILTTFSGLLNNFRYGCQNALRLLRLDYSSTDYADFLNYKNADFFKASFAHRVFLRASA